MYILFHALIQHIQSLICCYTYEQRIWNEWLWSISRKDWFWRIQSLAFYSIPFEWTWQDLYPISIPGCFECRSNWGPRWHVRKIDGPTVSGQLVHLGESSCKYWIPTRDKLETSFTYLARTCTFSQGKVLNTWPWVPRNKYHNLRSLCNFVVIYSSSIVWLLKPVM